MTESAFLIAAQMIRVALGLYCCCKFMTRDRDDIKTLWYGVLAAIVISGM